MDKRIHISVFFVLLAVYLTAGLIRVGVYVHHRTLHSGLPFTSESAIFYRYARMVSEGEAIPALDQWAQYPEGLAVFGQLSVGVEWILGYLYRFLPLRCEFAEFIHFAIPFFFSLGIFAGYLLGKRIYGDQLAGFYCALIYAVSLPAVIRSTGQEISKENFALPILFFHLYLFLKALRTGDRPKQQRNSLVKREVIAENTEESGLSGQSILNSIIAGILLVISLSLWEGSQVYFYLLVIFLAGGYLFGRVKKRVIFVWAIQILLVLLASLVIPYLRLHRYFTSYGVLISIGIILVQLLERRKDLSRKRRILYFVILLVPLISLTKNFGYGVIYTHMQSLFFAKLKFMNQKPADPSLIPYEVRILWLPDLLSPGIKGVWFSFSLLLFAGLGAMSNEVSAFFRRKLSWERGLVLFLASSTFILYLFFARLQVYAIFFLALLIGGWSVSLRRGQKKRMAIVAFIFVSFVIIDAGKKVAANIDYLGRPVDYSSLEDVVGWIRENTDEDDVILAHFYVSPSVLVYGERKIILHPKYEYPLMRNKVKRYAFALFDDKEEAFYGFCEENGADYFIFSRGTFSDSSHCGWRYITATPASRHHSNAYFFEYCPDRLKKFALVYANVKYYVFKIYHAGEIELAQFYADRGDQLWEAGDYRGALQEYKESLLYYPRLPAVYGRMGTACYKLGEKERAVELWRKARELLK